MRALIVALAAVLAAGWAGAADAACGPGDLSGLYEGSAEVPDFGPTDVTLNLACAPGGYTARLVTGMGEFAVKNVEVSSGRVRFAIDTGASLGTVELKPDGGGLSGGFKVVEDAGAMRLTRRGDAVAQESLDPHLDLTAAQWREDLRALAEQLPKRHAKAFFSLDEAEFDAAVADLDRRLPAMNADEAFIGLERIVNMIGDGHTVIVFPADRRDLPIEIARFGGDFRIVSAAPAYRRALGARIVSIGDTPIAEAHGLALTITPRGELDELREARAPYYLARGMALHGLGITPERDHAAFTLRDDAGRTFKLDIRGKAPDEMVALEHAWTTRPLWLQDADAPFRCTPLPRDRAVYCAFRSYQGLGPQAKAMFEMVDRTGANKLVIDMRDNGGGDNTEGDAHLVKPMLKRADLNRADRLYVLVGPLTFSAAMNNAAQFADETNATLVGETIGEKPNSYQEPRPFQLPNSRLVVRYSTLWYAFRKGGENAVRPDKTITPTWAQVKAGRDPVLEWVLSRPVR
jgi:hypothetical protein